MEVLFEESEGVNILHSRKEEMVYFKDHGDTHTSMQNGQPFDRVYPSILE